MNSFITALKNTIKNLSFWFREYQRGQTSMLAVFDVKWCEKTGLEESDQSDPFTSASNSGDSKWPITRIQCLFYASLSSKQPLLQWHISHSHWQRMQGRLHSRPHQSPSLTGDAVIQPQRVSLNDVFCPLQSENNIAVSPKKCFM